MDTELIVTDKAQEPPTRLDDWLVPPHTSPRRSRGRGGDRKGTVMTRPLVELVEQFCQYQLKQRGKTEGGVQAYRWVLEQFLVFGRGRFGRVARLSDLSKAVIQDWMDEMAARDLTLGTIRSRQSALSSFCNWLVKREALLANPIAGMDRPPHRIEPPKQVPTPALMDALIEAARNRQRPRDVAVFLILRFTGMRRESVATLQARHLDALWGLRRVRVKGGHTRDIPLPEPVMRYLHAYVAQVVTPSVTTVTPETPLFWSVWGRRSLGKQRAPMTGKNIWRLCKTYGRLIGYPMLKPHDLAPWRCDGSAGTTARPGTSARAARPCAHRHHPDLHDDSAGATEASWCRFTKSRRDGCWRVSERQAFHVQGPTRMVLKHGVKNFNKINVVVPTGFEPVFKP